MNDGTDQFDDDSAEAAADAAADNVVPINAEVELREAIAGVAEMRAKNRGGRPAGPADIRTPLQYMVWVMNNPKASPERRDKMAIAAAKYLHQVHGGAQELGKKEQKTQAAGKLTASGGKLAPAKPPGLMK